VDFVYCPDKWPVDPLAIAELDAHPALEREHTARRGVVYRVVK
jgi:hypothetical protein